MTPTGLQDPITNTMSYHLDQGLLQQHISKDEGCTGKTRHESMEEGNMVPVMPAVAAVLLQTRAYSSPHTTLVRRAPCGIGIFGLCKPRQELLNRSDARQSSGRSHHERSMERCTTPLWLDRP